MVVLRSKEILTKFKILLVLIFWSTNLYADDRTLLPVFDPFITTWQTSGATNLVTIPLTGAGYDFTIDWGDGTLPETKIGTPGNISHTYSATGIYTISITPNILTGFPRIYVNNYALRSNLLTVESWGSGQWGALLSNAFLGANNLEVNAKDIPDFSATTSFSSMFQNCTSLTGANGFANWMLNTTTPVSFASMFAGTAKFDGDISNWNVSSVTNMSLMFDRALVFNSDISSWDVSSVSNMSSMFSSAILFNQPLSWGAKTAKVTTTVQMFYNTSAFNQDISGWDVSSVTNMSGMFMEARAFNKPLNAWGAKTGKVTSMALMFKESPLFNQNISDWDVSKVTSMLEMFTRSNVFNQDLSKWDVSSVTNMTAMFQSSVFNSDISSWNVSRVSAMSVMFSGAHVFNQDLSKWDVSSVRGMTSMFNSAWAFNQDISNWNVSSVTNMSLMFANARVFNSDISSWDVSSVTNMSSMFSSAILFNQPLSWGAKTANVTNMSSMFQSATAFNQDLSAWDVSKVMNMFRMFISASAFNSPLDWNTKTANVTNMEGMFKAALLFNQDISNWDVGKVTTLNYMFRETKAFNQDLSAWNVANVTTMSEMFYQASAFNSPLNWGVKTGKVTNMSVMFYLAGAFNQDIGNWNISNVTSMTNFLFGARLSRANYDKILIGWSTLDPGETKIPINLNVHFGSSKYSNDPTVLTARDTELRGSKNWTITDGGMDSDFVLPIITGNVLASNNTSISITFSEGVYKTSLGSGTLEISDFLFSLSGGTATLNTTTPSSISTSNNITFILGIDINGTPNGAEVLTVTPMPDAIFDLSGNIAATSQDNNTVPLNDLSPPIISMPSGDAVSINENSTAVFTFTASKSVTWSLGTADDAALLNIDSSGKLAFNTAPDFENPMSTLSSNTYVVSIIATDAASNTDTKTLSITILDIPNTIFGTFAAINKQYFAGPHTIVPPATNNSNPIVYTSDNTAVATISASTITFTGIGTATITATQAADENYEGGSVSTLLTVLGKNLVTKFGGVSSTDVNYVDANGKVGGGFGVDKYGKKAPVSDDLITTGLVIH